VTLQDCWRWEHELAAWLRISTLRQP